MLNFEPSFFNFIFTFTNGIQREIKGESKKGVISVVFKKQFIFQEIIMHGFLQYFEYCFNFFLILTMVPQKIWEPFSSSSKEKKNVLM